MARTARTHCLALTFVVLSLLVKAKIDVCKRGSVTVKPSLVISLGSAVSISCSLKPKQGCRRNSSFNKLILYRSYQRIKLQHEDSPLSFQVSDLPLGTTQFVCKLSCSGSREIQICGAQISVGVVPEQPQNLSCTQKGERGTVACTWDRGRDTHLYTAYTVQLNGPKNLTWQKQCNDYCDHLDLGINLIPESSEFSYTAKVVAVNSLGSASSFPTTFTFLDIVRPLPPWDIGIKFVNASVSRCTLWWRDEGMVLLNRLRYRPNNSRSWNMVNPTSAKGRHDLLDLEPFTEYEFQVSSKLHLYKGSWSDWSKSLRMKTPEEEPTGKLDVWYMKQNIDYSKQQISLFWKNLSVSEARGKILHYQVTLLDMAGEKPTLQNTTEHTSWTWVIPRAESWTVAVSAANSKGSSLPTRINITDLCGAGFLAPGHVSANSEGTDSIMVMWEPPGKAASAVQQYVVEWRELHPGGGTQPTLNWLRTPPYNVSALISENIKPYICYEIHVHALSGDQGGCSSVQGNSQHKAPLSGPHINAITQEKGSILISWDEIPAQERMGCILHYRIYWKEQDSTSQPRLCGASLLSKPVGCSCRSLNFVVSYPTTQLLQTCTRKIAGGEDCLFTKGSQHSCFLEENSIGALCSKNNVFCAQNMHGCCEHKELMILGQKIPYRASPNSHPVDSLQPRVRYILWMTALTAAGESPRGNEREFCLQGRANWSTFMAPSICTAVIMVGIFSTRYFRQKLSVLLAGLRPQWCSRHIPDPANSTWAKKYLIVEEKMQLPLDRILTDWPTPKEPEPLVISEVLHQVTPAFRRLVRPNWPEKGKGVQGHYTSEEDTGYSASGSPPSRALTAEPGQLVDLYKVLGNRDPDSKPGNPASPSPVLPVDYLPTHEGYLPSNVDYLPSHEAPGTEPPEELEPQHISLSVFPSSSLHPLTFSCGEKLTLDRLKMGCGSLML